nr:NAD(P)-dependent alcohol dehydrogenase [Jiangella alkaliphila]
MASHTYGDPSRLRLVEIDRPSQGPGEVLVRVHAAGVDQGVWHLVAGLPYPIRPVSGLRRPKNPVPGLDLAGVVEAIGADVTAFAPGDEVFGTAAGTFAEYVVTPAAKLARKPGRLSFAEAASVPTSAYAALQAARDKAKVKDGDRVLVIGAGGGVGSYAVQVARAFGAEVTGVTRTAKLDLVRSLGATHVVDHTRTDVTTEGRRYDVVLDCGGHTPLLRLRRVLEPRGTLVLVGSEVGGRWLGGTDRALRAMLLSPFVRQRLGTLLSTDRPADLEQLRAMLDDGRVTPALDRTFPLEQAAEAIRYLREGQVRGKVALTL